MLTINYRDPRPIYEQVRDSLRNLILTGAIAPDEKLPSVRELAASLAINPNTIQRAYRELEAGDLIYTVPGKGAFAAPIAAAASRRQKDLEEEFLAAARELRLLHVPEDRLHALIQGIYGEEESK